MAHWTPEQQRQATKTLTEAGFTVEGYTWRGTTYRPVTMVQFGGYITPEGIRQAERIISRLDEQFDKENTAHAKAQ